MAGVITVCTDKAFLCALLPLGYLKLGATYAVNDNKALPEARQAIHSHCPTSGTRSDGRSRSFRRVVISHELSQLQTECLII